MTLKQLEQNLVDIQVPNDAYSLKERLPNEKYCIRYENLKWEVYYSERGNKTGLKFFSKEEDACEYFFNKMKKIFC